MDLEEIVQKYNIELMLTFGSYGTDRYRADSDIDIAFQSNYALSLNEELSLLYDLTAYFKKDRIDLVNLGKADPLLLYEIACHAKPAYEKGESFLRFKLKASARYADTKFLRAGRRQWLNEQLELLD
jgi:uncharacterized protein